MTSEIRVPDLGDFKDVEVIDVLVKAGDRVDLETPLITLETEKATLDVPSPTSGTIHQVSVKKGDRVSRGTVILVLDDPEPTARLTALDPNNPGKRVPVVPDAAYTETIVRKEVDVSPRAAKAKTDAAKEEPAKPAPAKAESEKPAAAPEPQAAPKTSSPEFDVVVLGAGPGGYTAAFRAADLGMKVALIERWPTLGGVCLNVGCIPSKALLHAAKVIEDAEAMRPFGIDFGAPKIDAGKLREWKNKVVGKLTTGLNVLVKQRKIEVIRGAGQFVSANEIEVDKRRVSFKHCIIAAGSESVKLPGLPDDPRIIDSTGALELDLPKRLLVIGGGIIGLEMATVYAALGVKVSVVELTDGLIPGCDRDLVKPLERIITKHYERILLKTKVSKVEAGDKGLKVTFEGEKAPEPEIYDKVLVAVGRSPNGKRIGAEAAGVHVNERGFIPVDRQMRTNVPHIFAIGDIVGPPMLAHKASHEGKLAAEVAHGEKRAFDARVIPSVAYTDPEIAWVGLTETDAKAKGIAYEKSAFPWIASGRSLSLGRDEGMTKLLFDKETHRIVGAGIVGPNAGDLIAEAALAIEMGCDASDIGLTIHPHPTLSETIAFAAEAFEGTLTDLYIPKKK